ncbi:hypothetical protein THASP1DRAFT_21309 [Thamnocephalis sphaerospora]|uniref:WIBG Mago-binding domain-containing protein n=1 Tax=Thamnocephalis sphaerospora TaxID=78915 RepID=A0A4P9XXJ5_9FUNG|nr:hypothetical protein THASP1DRAFT_21309 [Thamnocephalis sphaerospora]|eukprot:RKP11108.1 hypothetical protein THASP1DRAFT_21309 [Thamnocephalis sphaerospora]
MSRRLFEQAVTASGITTLPTPDGERIVPGTRRPDGTMRPTRRVRPGFTPVEDQLRFQSRRVAERQLPAGYVVGRDEMPSSSRPQPARGGSWFKQDTSTASPRRDAAKSAWDDDSDEEETKAESSADLTKAQRKNQKRTEKRAEKLQVQYEEDVRASVERALHERQQTTAATSGKDEAAAKETVADPERKARAVRKKIRQAEELRRRRDQEGTKLQAQEVEKIGRIAELEAELAQLTIAISERKK